jgi:hypothetical protein
VKLRGVSSLAAVVLLIVGIVIGVTGYYIATTYQTRTVTLTQTSTQIIRSTTTQTSVTVSTSTTSVYPVPTNVTVAFINVDGEYNYNIQAGTSTTSGVISGPASWQLTNIFQGEPISITASTVGVSGCREGEHFTLQLWVNGQLATDSSSFCGGSQASITYTV